MLDGIKFNVDKKKKMSLNGAFSLLHGDRGSTEKNTCFSIKILNAKCLSKKFMSFNQHKILANHLYMSDSLRSDGKKYKEGGLMNRLHQKVAFCPVSNEPMVRVYKFSIGEIV